MSMNYRRILLIVAALVLSSAPAYAAEISLQGSTSFISSVIVKHKTEIEAKSGHTLKVVSNASSKGLKSVNSGTTDLGMISAPLDSVTARVNKLAPDTVVKGTLIEHNVGQSPIAFTIHKSNQLKKLTRAQLKDILSGKIKKWSEVGGANFPVIVVTEKFGGGVRAFVEEELLGGGVFNTKMKELPSATQIPKIVAQAPAALGVMPSTLLANNIGVISLDQELVQPLSFVTKGEPTPEVQSVIDATREVMGYSAVKSGILPLADDSVKDTISAVPSENKDSSAVKAE